MPSTLQQQTPPKPTTQRNTTSASKSSKLTTPKPPFPQIASAANNPIQSSNTLLPSDTMVKEDHEIDNHNKYLGPCYPLLDKFAPMEFIKQLDQSYTLSENKWDNTPTSAPSPVLTKNLVVRGLTLISEEADPEIALMMKWAERVTLKSPIPRPALFHAHGDLHDRHLVQFMHSIYMWCKSNHFSIEETSVILGIGKLMMDRILATVPGYQAPPPPQKTPPNDQMKISPASHPRSAGTNKTSSPNGQKKIINDEKPPTPASVDEKLPLVPLEQLPTVLRIYLTNVLEYHASSVASDHHSKQKWQVLSAQAIKLAHCYFDETLLRQISLIRFAYEVNDHQQKPFNASGLQLEMSDTKYLIPLHGYSDGHKEPILLNSVSRNWKSVDSQ